MPAELFRIALGLGLWLVSMRVGVVLCCVVGMWI